MTTACDSKGCLFSLNVPVSSSLALEFSKRSPFLRFFSGFSRLRQIGSYIKRHASIRVRNPGREKDDRILGISWSRRADIPDIIHKKKKKKKCKFRSAVLPHDSVFNVCLISLKPEHIYVGMRSFFVSVRKKESARNEGNALKMCFSIF